MPGSTHPTPFEPISTHPGPAGPRRSPAVLVLFTGLLGLYLYALAHLPGWPLVLAALLLVLLAMAIDHLRTWVRAERGQGPRHHRARAPRIRHRSDPHAVLVVDAWWVQA